ncbi:MAG: FkbM family methyltransferase, partial [Alphaproteobacteria bacterium]
MTEQPPNSVFVRIHDGSEICVPNVIRRLTTYVLLEQEDWFESEIGFVRKAVQPGQAAIDIGASFGLYTSALGRATGPAGKVWAFEPAAVPRTHLLATLQRNGLAHVEVFAHALSDAPGEQVLANPGDTELGQLGGDEVFGERVSVETLDRLAGSFGDRPIDFVKLDAEGLEPRIIAAGHRIFADHSPLVMTEIVQGVTYQPAIADALQALGYDVFRHVPALNILVPFDAATRDAYLINVFACKPDRAAQLQARQLLVRETAPPAEPAPDAWLKLLAPMPYFGPLQAQMNRFAARPNHIADDTYRRALNLYAASRDENASAAHRWAALAEADRLLRGYEGDNIPHPQALSSARVAADIGRRVDAYN